MLATLLFVGGLVTAVAVISYLMSGQGSNEKPGLIQRMARYIPLQSVKIIIVAWQILTQVRSNTLTRGQGLRLDPWCSIRWLCRWCHVTRPTQVRRDHGLTTCCLYVCVFSRLFVFLQSAISR